jgi:hypothetical protein
MKFWRKTLPLIICFLAGTFMLISAYVPHSTSQDMQNQLADWLIIISSFALVLGLASLLHMHVGKIQRQVPGWGYSAIMVFALAITAFLGVFWGMKKGAPIKWIYNYMLDPMAGTMFSMLAFFIASAAYKAFRARTVEATILLVAGFIIMLGQIPIGGMISGGTIPQIKEWILQNPTMAAQRGIMLGVALSVVATSLRIILGIERSYLGGSD